MESFNGKLRDELLNVEVFDTLWEAKVLAERWRRQSATASQRLGLSAAGAGGQIPQVPGPEFYPMEWTSNGPRSNLESGLVPGGRSRLLIQKMGPRGTQPFADPTQVKSIFERAFDAGMRDSATLHHFALLLLDREKFSEANYFLTEAIAVLDDERELGHFKTESRQTLYNSMGMISGRHGLHLQLAGKEIEASEQFSTAIQYFRSARSGPSPSSYPYYCEAFINYSRARNSIGASKFPFLANALKCLDEAEGNVPDDDMSSLEEMEAKILQYMASNMPNRDQVINDQIAKGNPDGEYLKARINIRAAAGESQLETAYAILTNALERTPKHVGCLRLAARLHITLYPDDWEGWAWTLESLAPSRRSSGAVRSPI